MNQNSTVRPAAAAPTASAALSRKDLARAMSLLSRLIEPRTTIPVLSYARALIGDGFLRLSGTDLDMELTVELEAETSGEAAMMINARTLSAFAANAGDRPRVEVHVDPHKARTIVLTDGTLTIRLNDHIPVEDYPIITSRFDSDVAAPVTLTAAPSHWRRLLGLARPCVSAEETRYYLHGVCLRRHRGRGTLRALATNGHYAAAIESVIDASGFDANFNNGEIVPTGAVDLFLSLLGKGEGNEPVAVAFRGGCMKTTIGDATLFTKLIDGQFPDVDRIVPTPGGGMVAHLSLSLVKRLTALAAAAAGQRANAVELDLNRGEAILRSPDRDCTITHPIQASAEVSPARVGFNVGYLQSLASVAPTITISDANPSEAWRVEGDDPDALWVLMPMRV